MGKNVKLKNLNGDYLYPYTNNVPTDSIPINNSENLITSGAVYTALSNKLDTNGTATKALADANGNDIPSTYQPKSMPVITLSSIGTIALSDNSINRITPTGSITFSLPQVVDNNIFHQILVQINLTTAHNINLGTNCFLNENIPDLSKAGFYSVIYEHNGIKWTCGVLSMGDVASYTIPTEEDENILYAWQISELGLVETIYTKTLTITSTTKLYNSDASIYTGTEWSILENDLIYQDEAGKYGVVYAVRYEGGDIVTGFSGGGIASGGTAK